MTCRITAKRNEIIWKKWQEGKKSQAEIALEYGLCQQRVSAIIEKMSEKHRAYQISDFPSLDERLKVGWKHLEDGLTNDQIKSLSVKGLVNNLMRATQNTEWEESPEKFLKWLDFQTEESLCEIRGIGPNKARMILTIQNDIRGSEETRKALLSGCKWVCKAQSGVRYYKRTFIRS